MKEIRVTRAWDIPFIEENYDLKIEEDVFGMSCTYRKIL